MKKSFTLLLVSGLFIGNLYAQNKYDNISADYLSHKASLKVRLTIAKDPKTVNRILKALTNDSNETVRKLAKQNLES